mmetsp:Transcript_11766/g.14649  ORF Transcript_11766/g.14649 Transcript_11766/m.14649 type:complete len:83 (-) Transcript_11766:4624-4872(-)
MSMQRLTLGKAAQTEWICRWAKVAQRWDCLMPLFGRGSVLIFLEIHLELSLKLKTGQNNDDSFSNETSTSVKYIHMLENLTK